MPLRLSSKSGLQCPASLTLMPWHPPAPAVAAALALVPIPALDQPWPEHSSSVSCPDWPLSLAFGLHLDARTNGIFNKLLAYFRTNCKVQHN